MFELLTHPRMTLAGLTVAFVFTIILVRRPREVERVTLSTPFVALPIAFCCVTSLGSIAAIVDFFFDTTWVNADTSGLVVIGHLVTLIFFGYAARVIYRGVKLR